MSAKVLREIDDAIDRLLGTVTGIEWQIERLKEARQILDGIRVPEAEKKEAVEQGAPAAPPGFNVKSGGTETDGFGTTIKGEFIPLSERSALLAECMVTDGEPGFTASADLLQEKIGVTTRGPLVKALRNLREALRPHHYDVVSKYGEGYQIAAIAVLD